MGNSEHTTILYVDDEETNLFVFNLAFRKKYEVITAISPEKALEVLKEEGQHIQVVISDMRMPSMNGIQFIARAREQFPDLPYFILTGYDYHDEINQAINEGLIIRHFTKPFDVAEIENAIYQALDLDG
jgi:DNA-binding NtrC family response regulator